MFLKLFHVENFIFNWYWNHFFVSLTVISIIFPSLFSSVFGKFSDNLIPYEVGTLGVPVILSNLGLLFFGIIYYKKNYLLQFLIP